MQGNIAGCMICHLWDVHLTSLQLYTCILQLICQCIMDASDFQTNSSSTCSPSLSPSHIWIGMTASEQITDELSSLSTRGGFLYYESGSQIGLLFLVLFLEFLQAVHTFPQIHYDGLHSLGATHTIPVVLSYYT